MFWFHRDIDYTVWGTLPASFQNAKPILLFDLLGIGMPSVKTIAVMQTLFKLALLLACIGLFLVSLVAGRLRLSS